MDKQVIRYNVFETNSSSVHTLAIAKEGLEPSHLPTDKEGYILARYGSFGKERRYYDTQEEKLSYLVTCCYYLSHGWDKESLYENWTFREIQEAICEYTGAKGIRIVGDDEPEIDHQSQPDDGWDLNVVDGYDHEQVVSFVFNKYVSLKTDCD